MTPKEAKRLALKSARRPESVARKQRMAEELDPDMMFLGDGLEDTTYDAALVGPVQRPCQGYVACYDYDKCVECLMAEGMSHEDAIEWMEYNVVSAFVGDHTPVFLVKEPESL